MHVWRPHTYYDTLAAERSVVQRSYSFFQTPGGRTVDQTNMQTAGQLRRPFVVTGIALLVGAPVEESQTALQFWVGEFVAWRAPLANLRRDTKNYGKARFEYIPDQDHVPPLTPLALLSFKDSIETADQIQSWVDRARWQNVFVIPAIQNFRLELILGPVNESMEARGELHGHVLTELM